MALTALLSNLALFIGAMVAAFAAILFMQQRRALKAMGIPTVDGTIPILGSMLTVMKNKDNMNEWVNSQFCKHGPTLCFILPFQPPFIATVHPPNVEHLLKSNFDNYVKGEQFQGRFAEILGHGIFASDGQTWYTQRKTAAHMFTANSFRDHMSDVFRRNGDKIVAILAKAAETGDVIDMQDLYFRFTLDSVGEISFGTNIGAIDHPQTEFAHAFDTAQAICERRFVDPFWKINKVISAKTRVLNKAVATMDALAHQVIANRRKESAEQLAQRKDLLSRFMELEIDNAPPTDEYLRDIIMNFMIAGRDTTANALSWATYLLTTNPSTLQRLKHEVDGVPELGFDSLKNLEYTTAVVWETLRLFPSVPKDGKSAVNDDTLPDGTFVPAGAMLSYVPYSMGRSEALWPEPQKFDPLRFYQQPKPSPFKFSAFQAGPRICLGQNMALFEASIVLATVFRRFDLEPLSLEKPAEAMTATLPMRDGFKVRVHLRSDAPTA